MRIRAVVRAMFLLGTALLLPRQATATPPPASGPIAPEISSAFERGLFAIPARPHAPQTGAKTTPNPSASATAQEWLIPIIRVEFPDSALVYSGAALEQRLFDATGAVPTGSMKDYYDWVSGGRLNLRGEVVATVLMAHERNYYANDARGVNAVTTPNNSYGLFREAVTRCDTQVDFSRFDLDHDGFVDMLWIVHAGPGAENTTSRRDLYSITTRATAYWNGGTAPTVDDLVPGSPQQHIRIDRFTILPELSSFKPGQLSEIGVFCHEFGHALGLPDLYDASVLGGAGNVGPGNWALMSTGLYGGDGHSPESPAHLGAWSSLWLGWTNELRPTQDTTLVLSPIESGGQSVEFWFQGEDSPEHFLIENRERAGFDQNLPASGLIVTQVDEAVIGPGIGNNLINSGPKPGMRILEADGDFDLYAGTNHGDPNDPFPGQLRRTRLDDLTRPSTRLFTGAVTNIALENIQQAGRDISVHLRVRAPGWQEPGDFVDGAGAPLQSFGPAVRAVVSPSGQGYHVSSERVAGRSAVVLRERPWLQPWQPLQIIDQGVSARTDPSVALVGASDLAVTWIETTGGRGQVCYRSRVFGTWSAVHVLTNSSEGCLLPAIAADRQGRVFLAWLQLVNGHAGVHFMHFLYSAPYGQPRELTTSLDLPAGPAVAAGGNGHAYVLWPDRGSGQQVINGCRFDPDTGLSAPFRVGPSSAAPQASVGAAVDSAGTLHLLWQQSPGNASEIHYQRRPLIGKLSPRDTTLEALGSGLQNPRIAIDPSGGLHAAYEWFTPLGLQVRYKRWTPALGWDHRATEVSGPTDVTASTIDVLPTSTGNVTITWLGFDGIQQKLRQRTRQLDGASVTDVPVTPAAPRVQFTAGPNPLRAGQPLLLAGERIRAGAVVELLDAGGRRVAGVTADAGGRARLESAVTAGLAPGLYFVRIRGGTASGRVVVLR